MAHKRNCCNNCECYYKLVEAQIPIPAFNTVVGELLYNYYSPDNPSTGAYDPVVQTGYLLEPHTADNYVSACISSNDGQMLTGSAGNTNYWMNMWSTRTTSPNRSVTIEFKAHNCAVIKKAYIHGTDVDAAEFYDITGMGAGWTEHPANGNFTIAGGVYSSNAANQSFYVEYEGHPPAGILEGGLYAGNGQSVLVLLADYYAPLKTIDCNGELKHYDENGEYTGEVFTSEEIGTTCCNPVAPNFHLAQPSRDLDTTYTITGPDANGTYLLIDSNGDIAGVIQDTDTTIPNTDNQFLSTTTNPLNGSTETITISGGNTINIAHPPAQGLLATIVPIYHENYAAGTADGLTQSWNRNLFLTRTAVGQWNVTLLGAHPDGANYHVTITAEEQAGDRDTPDITIVQGTKTAAGFQIQITTGDNGGGADAYVDTPFTIGISSPRNVVTSVIHT